MRRPKGLDLFSGAGGASFGYHLAGFDMTGVDIVEQPNYPFTFIKADALEYVAEHGDEYAFIAASPPCQAYSKAQKLHGNEHPDLIAQTRERLKATGLPYVIENVPGAPLENPEMLCGEMFGLKLRRHRLFETNFPLPYRLHSHSRRQAKMGRQPRDGDAIQVVGHFPDFPYACEAMGIDWMTRAELAEAIPPAFTHWIGTQLLALVAS